jgi:hypothetical protein
MPGRPSQTPPRPLAAEAARQLLRKLRDLNLTGSQVAVDHHTRVSIDGCLSLDVPAESSLRYRLRLPGGPVRVLSISWRPSTLSLSLADAGGRGEVCSLESPLVADGRGRAVAPAIAARIDPSSAGEREVEHFLRRLVRGVLR